MTLDSPQATRPKADGIAFPFKLGQSLAAGEANASTLTLNSEMVGTPTVEKAQPIDAVAEAIGKKIDVPTGAETRQYEVEDAGATIVEGGVVKKETGSRPTVERFETAMEHL